MTELYKRKPNINCYICKNEVYRRPSEIKNKAHVFCSSQCYGISCRIIIPCIVCKKSILSGLNKKTCSRACSNINRAGIRYKINQPKDKLATLRRIKHKIINERGGRCERCNYDNIRILQIHHKNRNRTDNSAENLELICPNCHYEEHYLVSKIGI